MAFIQAAFFSKALQKQAAMNVIVPESKGPFAVFYLLHGLSDDHTIWSRRTRIESYVEGLPLVVVMPDGYRGFYVDAVEGPTYAKYMIEDVIGFAENTFPIIRKRTSRCIGGLSMGGYGALHLSLSRPDLFVSANSHSGALGIGAGLMDISKVPERLRIFGPNTGTVRDLFFLASKLKKNQAPKLRIDCGTEDGLLEYNRKFHQHLTKLKIPHQYEEFPGNHNWDYWDLHIREAIDFQCRALGIKKA
jgi:S-formylglutathione hydrolase FrmB